MFKEMHKKEIEDLKKEHKKKIDKVRKRQRAELKELRKKQRECMKEFGKDGKILEKIINSFVKITAESKKEWNAEDDTKVARLSRLAGKFGCQAEDVAELLTELTGEKVGVIKAKRKDKPGFKKGTVCVPTGNDNSHNYGCDPFLVSEDGCWSGMIRPQYHTGNNMGGAWRFANKTEIKTLVLEVAKARSVSELKEIAQVE